MQILTKLKIIFVYLDKLLSPIKRKIYRIVEEGGKEEKKNPLSPYFSNGNVNEVVSRGK